MVFVNSLVELIQSWWDFESSQEDSLLSLVKNVFGPSDETGHISFVLNITTDSEISRFGFEQRVLSLFDNFFFSNLVSLLNLKK